MHEYRLALDLLFQKIGHFFDQFQDDWEKNLFYTHEAIFLSLGTTT